jgi:hypothetical protein
MKRGFLDLLDPSNDPEFFWQVISGPPCIYRCPRTGSPEKKGSLRANILTCILKKKVLSQMITEKRHSEVDQSELSTIKVE